MSNNVLLFYPPVGLFQRGEYRCQVNVDASCVNSLRACNDLGVMASIFREKNFNPIIKDYPAEKLSWENFKKDIELLKPEFILMSSTIPTLEKDLEAFEIAKSINKDIITIACGAFFAICEKSDIEKFKFKSVDYAISGEFEFVLPNLLNSIQNNTISVTKGIYYWSNNDLIHNKYEFFDDNLDIVPFPARDLMNNGLYKRPDSGETTATINISRGCPSECIYCLSPIVNGKKIRKRSVKNVIDEIQECVEKYKIRSFFFKADSFTHDNKYIFEICKEIKSRNLQISWAANSRVDKINENLLEEMKTAGCWLIVFGIESGNEETLKNIKKNITKENIINSVKIAKDIGFKTLGFFMMGFPWERTSHINDTINFMTKLDLDFIDINICLPYKNTELYEMTTNLLNESFKYTGHDYFTNPAIGTLFLTKDEILKFKKKGIIKFYLRPKYIVKSFMSIKKPRVFLNYSIRGIKLLKNILYIQKK